MSTAGIFILLLIAFFVLHRWYTRPQAGTRRIHPPPAATAAQRKRPGESPGESDPPALDEGSESGAGGAGGGSGGGGSGGAGGGGSGAGGSSGGSGGNGGSGDGD